MNLTVEKIEEQFNLYLKGEKKLEAIKEWANKYDVYKEELVFSPNENKKELFSVSRFCGIGTSYSKVGSLVVDSEKVYIKAKIFSLFRIPFPKVFGYILSYDEDQILASYSNETFKEVKKEIKDTVLHI